MSEIPRAVLSEHFQERMKGRRLVAAIFTTFKFEPAFFETEILPVFFDIGLSHAAPIRLLQIEEQLRTLSASMAVYYDRHGLVPDGGAAKLDIRRIPLWHRTGIFHPKNVFLLVETAEADENGHHARALLCACLSANLTRAGWWENVEVAHIEEVAEGEHTNLRDSMLAYLDQLVRTAEGQRPNDELRREHAALSKIRDFLRGTTQRDHRSVEGRLRTHFHDGEESLPSFIEGAAGRSLRGMCLEIISPYFDVAAESAPLAALISTFEPREVQVFLPRNDSGDAECAPELFAWVQAQPQVAWSKMPDALLRLGKGDDVKRRTVHAKIYRFFDPVRGGRDVLYVGSTNLTNAGCRVAGRGGNWETGFLVEVTTTSRPEWWTEADKVKPKAFAPKQEDGGAAASGGTSLIVRHRWDRHETTVYWNDAQPSPALTVQHAGVIVLELAKLAPGQWMALGAEDSARLEKSLQSTSIFEVVGEGSTPGLLLVQEEGMHARPSLLLELSAADILRYWALLTVEQKAAFLDARARMLVNDGDDPLLVKLAPLPLETTLFDRFAGVFHAFACLEQRVREALDKGHTTEADYRLFGKKYDSLGSLLERVISEMDAGKGDRVEQYVVTLCAKQLLKEIPRAYAEYWREHAAEVKELEGYIGKVAPLRTAIAESNAEMPAFLEWFEKWFLKRAEPVAEEEGS